MGSISPRLSLALPVYNGEKFVAEAIRSILAQDYEDFELIITDNASTDRTEKICRDFAVSDGRIRYVRNEANLGAGPNFNLGFELSSGTYFKWCAADDCISKDFLGACVSVLDKRPDVVLVYGTTQTLDQEGSVIPLVGQMIRHMEERDGPARRFQKYLFDKASVFEIFGVFRRDTLAKTSLHRSYFGSDRTLITEMALLGRLAYVPDIIFYNREHPDRSVNITDKRVRFNWLDTRAESSHELSHCRRLAHLIEIAIRHGEIVPPTRSLAILLVWALGPPRLARYTTDLIGVVSPSAQHWLLRTGRWLIHISQTSFLYVLGATLPRSTTSRTPRTPLDQL